MSPLVRIIPVLALALALAGCASSTWQDSFVVSPAAESARLAPTDGVAVRSVEWERLDAFRDASDNRLAITDLPVDEWPETEHDRDMEELLGALRITDPPERVALLGTSSFVRDGPPRLDDPSLESFARRTGADFAVVSWRYLGTRRVIVRAPLTRFTSTSGTARFDTDGRDRRVTYDESTTETVWVPRETDIEAFQVVAYFLRVLRPDDPPLSSRVRPR